MTNALLADAERASSGVRANAPSALSADGFSKRFGPLVALEDVSFTLREGTIHALLGENGAGKSTLVKCLMGFYRADAGTLTVFGQRAIVKSPRDAQRHGIGMVYQHFTLVDNMTVAENLVLAQATVPRVIDWRREHEHIERFMAKVPFQLPPGKLVRQLAAGEKQKLEILKQLYLGSRVIILDEPTSVLTPDEADEVLGTLKQMARAGDVSIAMITHKFREVLEFSDEVTVLRKGRVAGSGATQSLDAAELGRWMVGSQAPSPSIAPAAHEPGRVVLELRDLHAHDDTGVPALRGVSFSVRAGEIVGIAGVSGNGQEQLVQVLAGQRRARSGEVLVDALPYTARRSELRDRRVRVLPEAPLENACAANMSVAENLALRDFDRAPQARFGFVQKSALTQRAARAVHDFAIRCPSPAAPIGQLSGGNVQRVVLARELAGSVGLLIAANPCFGLDFAAVAEVRARIARAARTGTAVLLISADLDEIFALSDRILVFSQGRVVYEADAGAADLATLGRCMAGHAA